MRYQIIDPPVELSAFVMCYWTLDSPKVDTPEINTIVPDGTIKMIFHYGDAYKYLPENGESYDLPKGFVIGQLTRPYKVSPTGKTGTFFVRFRPNGFGPFSTLPLKAMENAAIPLDKLYGQEGIEVQRKILESYSTTERISHIEEFLYNKLKSTETVDRMIQSTIETIFKADGKYTIHRLSRISNTNRRQLARKFSSSIGLSPKQLSKIIRLQSTLKILLSEEEPRLTDLAYDKEYYDQAHFIKDFKEFTGLTPKEFYGQELKMSLIFDS